VKLVGRLAAPTMARRSTRSLRNVCAGRPENEPAARYNRRRHGERHIQPSDRATPFEPTEVEESRRCWSTSRVAHSRPSSGNWIPPRLLVARRAGGDPKGYIRHDGGIVDSRFVLVGHAISATPKSSLIDGVGTM
jgi:hypothetical protein